MRNILGHTARYLRKELAPQLKVIFQADDKETAMKLAKSLIEKYENKASNAMNCLENGLEDTLTCLTLPEKYRQRLRTTNLPERVNEEIRRRQRVVRIFPNESSAL